jgi:hypothetical protein
MLAFGALYVHLTRGQGSPCKVSWPIRVHANDAFSARLRCLWLHQSLIDFERVIIISTNVPCEVGTLVGIVLDERLVALLAVKDRT